MKGKSSNAIYQNHLDILQAVHGHTKRVDLRQRQYRLKITI